MSSERIQEASPQYEAETTESAKLILDNVRNISELSFQFKNETKGCEKYLDILNKLVSQAGNDVSSLQSCVDSLLLLAKKLVSVSLKMVPVSNPNFNAFKIEADKLLSILDEITEDEGHFDAKLRGTSSRSLLNTNKCLNVINERYPEHCSRESLLDISNVVSLPTVPEDVFTDFCRPVRTTSSSSLKNMRRVKMCLQKMSDDGIDQPSTNGFSPSSSSKKPGLNQIGQNRL